MIDRLHRPGRHWAIYGASGLLLLLFLQAALSSPLASPTFDEPYDLARGYAYARHTDLRMQQEHPVLVDGLGGLMLRLMPYLTPPERIPGWEDAHLFRFSQALLWELGHDVDKMVFLARFPVIGLALILGAVVYRWAADLYGAPGGLLALALCALNPNVVAHARILSTDLGAACLAMSALYLWWRWAQKPPSGVARVGISPFALVKRAIPVALVLGLALAAKTTNTLLIPLIGLFTLIRSLEKRWRWTEAVVAWVTMASGALFVLWVLYRFEFGPAPNLIGDIPVPAPSYWEAIAWVRHEMELGRPAFLGGRYTIWGWWYYFPFAFLVKTPLPLLILLVLAVWLHVRGRIARRIPADYALWVFPPFYFILSAFSTLNLGYRHILSTVPLMTIYAARVVHCPGLSSKWARRGLWILLAWLAIGALCIFPHHLAYFNELVGGPSNGYRYLVDSNLDWGQGLKHLRRYLLEHDIDDLWLGYFGTADPAYYLRGTGIDCRSLFGPGSTGIAEGFSPINPAPGWYAISATVLQGPFSPERGLFEWFRRHEPVAKVGYSILVYRVKPDPDPPAWLGFCYTPEAVMSDAEIAHRFGRDDLRVVHVDCEQTWVYPEGGEPGWYLVPLALGDPLQDEGKTDADVDRSLAVGSRRRRQSTGGGWGTLAEESLAGGEIVYREPGLGDVPGYVVWRVDRRARSPLENMALRKEVWSSPTIAPVDVDAVTPLSVPVDLGGQVVFLGYRLRISNAGSDTISPDARSDLATVRRGDEMMLTTAWRVSGRPETPPFSVFAHILGAAGAVSVGDGLGFPAVQWIPGDVFIQRNRLPIPSEISPGRYWVQVGLYSLTTGERLPVLEGRTPVDDRILLGQIEVQ